ncbi:MAG: Ig-like domain-containing domain, partial [Planctomycetota bacterium]
MSDRARILLLGLVLAGLVVGGCRIEWLNDEESVKDLVVISTSPSNSQTNVSQTTTVIIRTSVPLDPEFVVPNQAEPWKNSQVILVDATNAVLPVSYSFAGELLTLTPLAPLGVSNTYGVAVRPGTRDIYGKNIKTPYAFTFSTGSSVSAIPNWPPFPLPGGPGAAPATPGTFSLTGQLNVARCLHEDAALDDGRVLITGGCATPGSTPFRSAEVYDPATQSWSLSQSNQGNG